MASYSLSLLLALGTCLRLWLFQSRSLSRWLAERHELVTPVTSWKRVTEGLALRRAGVAVYDGDVFHETPLMLRAVDVVDHWMGTQNVWIAFVVADLLTAIVLGRLATEVRSYVIRRQDAECDAYVPASVKLILSPEMLSLSRLYVVAAYMLNPLTVATCVAMSTAVFHHLILALALLFTLRENRLLMCVFIALAAYELMYPIMLIVPAALLLAHAETHVVDSRLPPYMSVVSVIQTFICFTSAACLLLYSSHYVEGSWGFLHSTYEFVLTIPDLAPNVGIFWYFFTEVFDHFRTFFVFVFQLHVFIYIAPLTIRLREHPLFLAYMLLSISAIFRSYPSLADTAFYMSLLPLWRHLLVYMRNTFISVIMFCVGVVLAPVLWYLWISAGSANANFYFAITLVISTAQVLLVTDLLFAYLRREFDLFHGVKPTTAPDKKPAMVILD
jgi:phosphatidylinositol glycan class U